MSHSDAEAAIKTLDGVDMRGSVVRLTEHTAPAGQTWSAPVGFNTSLLRRKKLSIRCGLSAPLHLVVTVVMMTDPLVVIALEVLPTDVTAMETVTEIAVMTDPTVAVIGMIVATGTTEKEELLAEIEAGPPHLGTEAPGMTESQRGCGRRIFFEKFLEHINPD